MTDTRFCCNELDRNSDVIQPRIQEFVMGGGGLPEGRQCMQSCLNGGGGCSPLTTGGGGGGGAVGKLH